MTNKEKLLILKNLTISDEWKNIKLELFEEIKKRACLTAIDGNFIKGMLKTIDIVDSWEDEFLKIKRKEEEKGAN